MFVVQMRQRGKEEEIWDETVPLPTLWDAENHIEIDRSHPLSAKFEYRIVEIKKDFH